MGSIIRYHTVNNRDFGPTISHQEANTLKNRLTSAGLDPASSDGRLASRWSGANVGGFEMGDP